MSVRPLGASSWRDVPSRSSGLVCLVAKSISPCVIPDGLPGAPPRRSRARATWRSCHRVRGVSPYLWSRGDGLDGSALCDVQQPPVEDSGSARHDRYVDAKGGSLPRDGTASGTQSWSSGDGAGAADSKELPSQRASSSRPPYGQEGRGYGIQSARDGSPSRDPGSYGRPGNGAGSRGSGGGIQGHRLNDSDFPLEMGGTVKPEKPPQLRPRGESHLVDGPLYRCSLPRA